MKLGKSTIVLLLAFVAGLCLLLYPAVSDWWNSFNQSRAIAGYLSAASNMDADDSSAMLEQARSYNADLLSFANRYYPTDFEHQRYLDALNVTSPREATGRLMRNVSSETEKAKPESWGRKRQ